MKQKQKKFTADFETATWLENETWVWAWAVCSIDNPEKEILKGNTIESFMDLCKQGNDVYYFHNLKFDGEFIIYYLLKNGFKHVKDKKEAKDNTFVTLISDMGQFYSIEVYFKRSGKHVKKVTFFDSLKIIPLSVEQIAKSFNLPISKLKIDYNKPRKKGHILTKEEADYIENDVKIVALALKQMFDQKLTRMTQGSNALHDFKDTMTKSRYERLFPELNYDLDKILRESYKGGFTYLSPEYTEKDVYNIVNLDVNSLYPSVMYTEKMPIGEPIYFKGQYKEDKIYNLYIQRFSCDFEIKENKIPTVQIKHGYNFSANEYLTSSDYEYPTLVMTNIDFELFKEQYNIYNIKYVDGWKFKSMGGIFTEYIDKWIKVKNEATISGNSGLRTIAKRMLNSLYGKFATSLDEQDKIPYLEEDVVHYSLGEEGRKKGLYLPIRKFYNSLCTK